MIAGYTTEVADRGIKTPLLSGEAEYSMYEIDDNQGAEGIMESRGSLRQRLRGRCHTLQ